MAYLLPQCEITSTLWSDIFNCVRVAWIMPKRVVDLRRQSSEHTSVENGFILPFVVSLEGKK